MKDNGTEAKEKIINTVINLLLEHKDVNKITNRQIASMAGVNSALINYYYQSKENLLNKAVDRCMKSISYKLFEKADETAPPDVRLRNMVKTISTFVFGNYELSAIAISSELKSGSLFTNRIILPILKEVFGESKSEASLKLMAMQIVVPLQIIFLNASEYQEYLREDVFDEKTRNKLLDMVIDNVLQGGKACEKCKSLKR